MATSPCTGDICAYEPQDNAPEWGKKVGEAGWVRKGNQIELATTCPRCNHEIHFKVGYIVGLHQYMKVRKWCNCPCHHPDPNDPKAINEGCGWGGDIQVDGNVR